MRVGVSEIYAQVGTLHFLSQSFSLYAFLFFAHLWWVGVLGLGSCFGFLGLRFSANVVGAFGVGTSGFFGVWALYIIEQ